jgi:hypothetical protein
MLGDCLLDLDHEPLAIAPRVIPDARQAVDAQVFKLGRARSEFCAVAPKATHVLHDDDLEIMRPRGSKQLLIARAASQGIQELARSIVRWLRTDLIELDS